MTEENSNLKLQLEESMKTIADLENEVTHSMDKRSVNLTKRKIYSTTPLFAKELVRTS